MLLMVNRRFFSNKERGLEESELFEDMSVLGGFRL
jgi:hypothetical protein